jgi:hypothetical protein
LRKKPRKKAYLFVGGPHHGKLYPVSDRSIAESLIGQGTLVSDDSADPAIYVDYVMFDLRYAGDKGGRLVAFYKPRSLRSAEHRIGILCEALSQALDGFEASAAAADRYARRFPHNEALEDDPGQPAGSLKRTPTE